MEALSYSLNGLVNFGLYFAISIISLALFKVVYTASTPYDEMRLVKEEKNTAAGIGLAGALIGFSIALSAAASNSVGFLDFLIWDVIAMGAQILAFFLVRLLMPKISSRITEGEIPAGIILASASISIGLLNAGCMSY